MSEETGESSSQALGIGPSLFFWREREDEQSGLHSNEKSTPENNELAAGLVYSADIKNNVSL